MPKIKKLVLKRQSRNLTFSIQRKEKSQIRLMEQQDFDHEELPSPHNRAPEATSNRKADEILAKAQMILDFDGDIPEPEMPPYSSLR